MYVARFTFYSNRIVYYAMFKVPRNNFRKYKELACYSYLAFPSFRCDASSLFT